MIALDDIPRPGQPSCPLCGSAVIDGPELGRETEGVELFVCANVQCYYWRREPPLGLKDEKRMGPPVAYASPTGRARRRRNRRDPS